MIPGVMGLGLYSSAVFPIVTYGNMGKYASAMTPFHRGLLSRCCKK